MFIKLLTGIMTAFVGTFIIDRITGRKLINPFKMIAIFGKPGSGKSTLETKWMYKDIKRKWEVYTDNPTVKIPGIKYFDIEKFKSGEWLPDGRKGYKNENGEINEEDRYISIYWDEIGIAYSNRDFKNNLNPKTLAWWKKHRHNRVKVVYGSQSYKDMDLKIRNLTDKMYLVNRSFWNNLSIAKPILIKMDIQNNENTESSGGQIVEKFSYDIFIFWKPILLQRWIHKFDSYN